ncbi:MAG: futalosine hydrolase [Bacteroidota bacterium]
MKILLVSSTQQEIEPFLKEKRHMDVLISGVGIAASTYSLTKQLLHHHYDLVIQAGVAGSFKHNGNGNGQPAMGEVVTVSKDVFGDLGAYEQQSFKSVNDLQLSNELEWLHNKQPLLDKLPYKKVTALTVNTVTDDKGIIGALQQKWDAAIESMEGAVLHYVCSEKEIPFIQLRAVCNEVGERDKSKWQLEEAITNLNIAISKTIAAAGIK